METARSGCASSAFSKSFDSHETERRDAKHAEADAEKYAIFLRVSAPPRFKNLPLMSALTGKNPGQNYTGLLHVSGPGPLHATTPRAIVLGDGSATPLSVTATKLYINGVEAGAGGGGGTALTSYATQIATLGDYPLSFPPELGTSGTTACAGNDSRLSNARTPTAHAASHVFGGSDPLTLTIAQISDLGNASVGTSAALSFGITAHQVSMSYVDDVAVFVFGSAAAGAFKEALGNPFPEYLWANRPNAATYNGKTIRITDICAGGSLWMSNGTRWYPVSKYLNLVLSNAQWASANLTTEQTAATVVIPGGLMDANTSLQFSFLHSASANSNSKIARFYFGGVKYLEYDFGLSNQTLRSGSQLIVANNSVSAQKSVFDINQSGTTGTMVTSSINTATDVTCTVTIQKSAGSNTVNLERLLVQLIYP